MTITRDDMNRMVRAIHEDAQTALSVDDALCLLGGYSLMTLPRRGIFEVTLNQGIAHALADMGWVVVMSTRQAREVILAGTAYDLLAEMRKRADEILSPVAA